LLHEDVSWEAKGVPFVRAMMLITLAKRRSS